MSVSLALIGLMVNSAARNPRHLTRTVLSGICSALSENGDSWSLGRSLSQHVDFQSYLLNCCSLGASEGAADAKTRKWRSEIHFTRTHRAFEALCGMSLEAIHGGPPEWQLD